MPAPIRAPQKTASSPELAMNGMSRYFATTKRCATFTMPKVAPERYAQMRYVPALKITGPMARPSRPSVRFTAFDIATTVKTANTM